MPLVPKVSCAASICTPFEAEESFVATREDNGDHRTYPMKATNSKEAADQANLWDKKGFAAAGDVKRSFIPFAVAANGTGI